MAGDATSSHPTATRQQVRRRTSIAVLLLITGSVWIVYAWRNQRPPAPLDTPAPAQQMVSGAVASMDSPALHYSEGWQVSRAGADPNEPTDPWLEPSGILTFTYAGADLALNLGVGDFWGYVYVTVDGQPANLLPHMRGNNDSSGAFSAYRTFYEPDQQVGGEPVSKWVRVHRDARSKSSHDVHVEVWRSWDQTPLRGIAVDAMPAPSPPIWPGMALMLLALAALYPAAQMIANRGMMQDPVLRLRSRLGWLLLPNMTDRTRLLAAGAFFLVTACGVALSSWLLTVSGLAALAFLSLARPALWTAALLFSLPFYFSCAAPVLPNRSLGLIDALMLLGIAVVIAHKFLSPPVGTSVPGKGRRHMIGVLLAVLIGWALIAAVAADHLQVALYEWRTVFLSAGLFAILLTSSLRSPASGRRDLWLIVTAWIAGGVTVAAIGLVQYVTDSMLITAEGVHRIRALYGSPNNLALYLERTFMVSLSLAAFLPASKWRTVWAAAACVQAAALLLTFSKGSLLLGVPAGLFVLWLGGMILLPRQGRSRRPLAWLAAAALVFVLALLPFLGTERFQRLLDFSQGTGYLRLQLWRSAWQMALDHPLLGVGPDNFLYAYRSAYLLPQAWQEPNLNHPHNWILDWWTRIGVPGLAVAVGLFTLGFYRLWRAASTASRAQLPEAVLNLGLLAAGVAALTHGLIDASYALPDLMIVWVLILMAAEALPEYDNTCSGSGKQTLPVQRLPIV